MICYSTSSYALAQFDGLMVDGTTIRRFNVTTGTVLDTRTITGQENLGGMLAMESAQQYLYLIDGFNDAISDRTFRLDWQTGAGTIVGNTGFNWNGRWLDFNPVDGVLYGGNSSQLYSINTITGAATFLRNITAAPGTTQLGQITAFCIRGDGQAFVADLDNFGNNDYQLYSLNLSTGQAARIGTMFTGAPGASADDLTFAPDGNLYATRRQGFNINNELYRVDPLTGVATFLYNVGTGSSGLGVAFVPEPTCAMIAVVLSIVWFSARRRPSPDATSSPSLCTAASR